MYRYVRRAPFGCRAYAVTAEGIIIPVRLEAPFFDGRQCVSHSSVCTLEETGCIPLSDKRNSPFFSICPTEVFTRFCDARMHAFGVLDTDVLRGSPSQTTRFYQQYYQNYTGRVRRHLDEAHELFESAPVGIPMHTPCGGYRWECGEDGLEYRQVTGVIYDLQTKAVSYCYEYHESKPVHAVGRTFTYYLHRDPFMQMR